LTAALLSGLASRAAATPAPGWDIDHLMASLAAVKSAQAHFVERKYMSVLKEPLEVSGTLIYNAPGHLEKNTVSPQPERLVVDQDQLTFERDGGRQKRTLSLQEYPEIWAFVESIRATLAGDAATLNRFYTLDLAGNALRWHLSLVPRDEKMHALVSGVTISGTADQVDTIEIQEADGDHSVMTVHKDP
jgi:hypothetical protein